MMNLPPADGSTVPEGLGARWKTLVARALNPDDVTGQLGDTIRLFGELSLARRLTEPVNARDQCIHVSTLFESMLTHRGIPAETVDGFCFAQVPPFSQEAILAGHSAVHVPAARAPDDTGGGLVIDWTARQFDPAAPVPLITTLTDWRGFWRDLAAAGGRGTGPRTAQRPPRRTQPAARTGRAERRSRGQTSR